MVRASSRTTSPSNLSLAPTKHPCPPSLCISLRRPAAPALALTNTPASPLAMTVSLRPYRSYPSRRTPLADDRLIECVMHIRVRGGHEEYFCKYVGESISQSDWLRWSELGEAAEQLVMEYELEIAARAKRRW